MKKPLTPRQKFYKGVARGRPNTKAEYKRVVSRGTKRSLGVPAARYSWSSDEYETTLHVHSRKHANERATMVLDVPLALIVARDLRTQGYEVTLVVHKRKAKP